MDRARWWWRRRWGKKKQKGGEIGIRLLKEKIPF